jgi:hypothetical protein
MSQMSHPLNNQLNQRGLMPLVQLLNHSGMIALQLDLSTYPPRIVNISGSGMTSTSLPLGKYPLLPLVQRPTGTLAQSLTNLSNDDITLYSRHSSTPNMCVEPSQLQLPSLPHLSLSTPRSSPDPLPNTLESPPMSPLIPCPCPLTPLTPPSLVHPPNQSQSLPHSPSQSKCQGTCHGCTGKVLDSAVMTMRAECIISYEL